MGLTVAYEEQVTAAGDGDRRAGIDAVAADLVDEARRLLARPE